MNVHVIPWDKPSGLFGISCVYDDGINLLIAKGEIDIGLFNVSEIPRAPGVVQAGPVPAAVQVYINYDSALPVANAAPDAALALLKFFHRPVSRAVWDNAGLEVTDD